MSVQDNLEEQVWGDALLLNVDAVGDSLFYRLIITSTIADRTPPDLQLFRNYRSPQSLLGISDYDHPELSMSSRHAASAASEQLVWRAARASGAAPSFFRPEGKYIDGGILANNPSLDLLTEVAEYNAALKALDRGQDVVTPSVLVSLGTGVPPVRKVMAICRISCETQTNF